MFNKSKSPFFRKKYSAETRRTLRYSLNTERGIASGKLEKLQSQKPVYRFYKFGLFRPLNFERKSTLWFSTESLNHLESYVPMKSR